MNPLIQKLTETFSPSGYETAIRDLIRDEIKPLADEIRVDALGNLIARKGPSTPFVPPRVGLRRASAARRCETAGSPVPAALAQAGQTKNVKKIMLAAHMDEIGLIATHIDENGFIRFTTLGGVHAHTLLGGRVRFAGGAPGVIGGERITDTTKTYTFEQLFIDVGAANRKACSVKVGEVAAFERPFLDLGGRLVAKSMDDRIGCAVLIETLRGLKTTPHELYFVFSTQEEVGIRGVTGAAFGLDPDLGLAVDVTGTGDTPKSSKMEVALGKGPAVKVKDGGMISDPRVVDWMIRAAEKAKLPYQREVLEGGTTDARAMQLTRSGVPAGCLSVPCRYIHSPSEMVDASDVQNAVKLLIALLNAPIELK